MEKKILIINVNWVGDVLFSTPFIRAVREAYQKSYIACLIHPRCIEMLEGNPHLNELIIYDEEGRHKGFLGKLDLISKIRKKRFNTAFILHRSFTKAALAYLAGIDVRIGYPTKHRTRILTKSVEEPAEALHKVEYFLNILRAVGIKPKHLFYEFFINDSDKRYIKDFLEKNGVRNSDMLIAICPGGNWDMKRWPRENYAKVSDLLQKKHNAKIVIVGAYKDIGLAEDIKLRMNSPPIIACGQTTLKQLGALLERANLVIANDTGPMHIAVSMKAKTISLFGPTSPKITGPYGNGDYKVMISRNEACDLPCYDVTCADNRCMAAISVDEVFSEASKMLTHDNR